MRRQPGQGGRPVFCSHPTPALPRTCRPPSLPPVCLAPASLRLHQPGRHTHLSPASPAPCPVPLSPLLSTPPGPPPAARSPSASCGRDSGRATSLWESSAYSLGSFFPKHGAWPLLHQTACTHQVLGCRGHLLPLPNPSLCPTSGRPLSDPQPNLT